MIDFNKNSVFNLSMIKESEILPEIHRLLIKDEAIFGAFKTIRDQLIFTNKRIISADAVGVSGKGKSYSSLPYSKVQFFSVVTPGKTVRIDKFTHVTELHLYFANGYSTEFDFKDDIDILRLCNAISTFILS